MSRATLYLIAFFLISIAAVIGLIQGLTGAGWLVFAIPFALACMMLALWSKARRDDRTTKS
jgi:hypothetical protein